MQQMILVNIQQQTEYWTNYGQELIKAIGTKKDELNKTPDPVPDPTPTPDPTPKPDPDTKTDPNSNSYTVWVSQRFTSYIFQ
jgi:hypothetical protein